MSQIHIGRGTTNLGVYEEEQVKAGLITGRFLLSDLGWKEGMAGWKPLSEFAELENAPTHESVQGTMPDLSPEGGESKPTIQAEGDGEGLPWDRREEIGLAQAYLQTVKLVLTEPGRAFSSMQKEGGLMEPLIFALIGGVIGGIAALIYFQSTLHNPLFIAKMQELPPQLRSLFGTSAGMAAVFWIPFRIALGVFVGAAVLHLCLMLVGGAKRPFETTFRVVCYCMGSTNLLLVIPVCGGMIAGVWGLIVEVIGLAKAHQTETGRALTAVLLPVICCCAFFVALIFAGVALGLAPGAHSSILHP